LSSLLFGLTTAARTHAVEGGLGQQVAETGGRMAADLVLDAARLRAVPAPAKQRKKKKRTKKI
jgi:hypothetical protein